jgi:S1-C subfamily serine protease
VAVWLTAGCTHPIEVRNLERYAEPVRLDRGQQPLRVAVLPFAGPPEALFYFNAVLERLNRSPAVAELRTDYAPGKLAFFPDVVVSFKHEIDYSSSFWNLPINWPGFLVFAPAWNGYIYHGDITTHVAVYDGRGSLVSDETIPVRYEIRHADMDRTIWTGLAWLEVSALALIGGFYNALVFDEGVVGGLQTRVHDNYATLVTNHLVGKIVEMGPSPHATGTCFAIDRDGTIVTAHHVVAGAQAIRVLLPSGDWDLAEVGDVFASEDLAVLRVERRLSGFLPLAPVSSTSVGQPVFSLGYPPRASPGVAPELAEGAIQSLSGPGGEAGTLTIDVPIGPGRAGSPVLNDAGQVVGVVAGPMASDGSEGGSASERVNWAVGVDALRPLLGAEPVTSRSERKEWAIRRARSALCYVEAIPRPDTAAASTGGTSAQ